MKSIAILLMLFYPVAADAQRPNRARANVQKMLARSAEQGGAEQRNSQSARQHRGGEQRRGNRPHQPPPRSARAKALSRSVDEVRMPAGWNTPAPRPHGISHGNRWSQMHRPGGKSGRFPGRFPHQFPGGTYYTSPYYSYGFGWGYYPSEPGVAESTAPPPPVDEGSTTATTGLLRLEVTPASGLDYYVDGVFIGNSSTLGSDIELPAGARHVEVRAAGYKPLVFDVRISVGRETTFRAAMEPLNQPQAPPPTGNRSMYIIPGCYVGNAPPSARALRPGCDINKLITR